jgi:hypothetical protein
LYSQFAYLPEETCFQQAGSCVVEGTCQAVLGSSDEPEGSNYQPALSLFLKSERIPALLYVGKGPEYKPFFDLRSVPEAKWPPLWALHFGKRPSVYCVLEGILQQH